MKREQLEKLQREMARRDVGALLLTSPVSIRYATGLSVMPIWTALNLARYALVPVEGEPAIFEYGTSLFLARREYPRARAARAWQFRFAQHEAADRAREWAEEIRAQLVEWGLGGEALGVETLDPHGFRALEAAGLRIVDGDEPMQAARLTKTAREIGLVRRSVAVAEAALHDLEAAIRPGVTENELLGVFWGRMIALGGEHCSTRLLASGERTNPWFHEAGERMTRPGDLVGIDTDMIGPEGYLCDISRTFLCGESPSDEQRECYDVAYDFVQAMIERCRPGVSYSELHERHPRIPDEYQPQSYPCMIHGAGNDDEPPFISYSHDGAGVVPRGELQEGMVLCVEFYAGKVGGKNGVKLEEQILVTSGSPERLSRYPYWR